MGATMSIGYYFEAMERSKESLVVMLARGFVFPAIFLYSFSASWQDTGLWVSIPVAECVSMILAIILIFVSKKLMKNKFENAQNL